MFLLEISEKSILVDVKLHVIVTELYILIPLSARICPNWTSAFEAYLGGSRDKYGRIWWADGNNTNLASTYIIDIIENMLFYSVC